MDGSLWRGSGHVEDRGGNEPPVGSSDSALSGATNERQWFEMRRTHSRRAITIGEGEFAHHVLQAIDKCLRIQEVERYQNCKELLHDLQEDQSPDRNRSIGNTFRNWVRSRFNSSNQWNADQMPKGLMSAAVKGDRRSQYLLAQQFRYGYGRSSEGSGPSPGLVRGRRLQWC